MPDSKKNKHMTLDDRIEIQECLNHGMTFKAIGARIGKDQTTVSKEVKKHITHIESSIARYDRNRKPIEGICPSLLKAPFVCNPCLKSHSACAYAKQKYIASKAQTEYESLLSESREGIPLNKEKFWDNDRIIAEGVTNGQHIYHILKANNLNVSKSTVYRHLHKGYLSVSKMDFPRVVKFKERKPKHEDYVPKGLKVGRTYDDFLLFIQDNGISHWVEMDTVIGRIGGKVILVFTFTCCNFSVGILLNNKTAAETSSGVIALKASLSNNNLRFGDIFPVILTDNGSEFSDIFSFINDLEGVKESELFFCDPFHSSQKPRVEKNHTLFRDIVPKGTSFDDFTQQDVNLIFSHVNGVKRNSLNGKSAYDIFLFTYDEITTDALGISFIPPKEVIQSPLLLDRTLKAF